MTFSQGPELSEDDDDDDDDGAEKTEDDDAEDVDEKSDGIRRTAPEPELDDILHDDCELPTPNPTDIIPWLDKVYKSCRGFFFTPYTYRYFIIS